MWKGILRYLMLLMLIVPFSAAAQEEDETKEEEQPSSQDYYVVVEESLPDFSNLNTTTLKLPVLLQWTPASVGVVTSTLFNIQDARTLNDALKNVSGINIQTGFGTFDFFTIRGLDSLSSALVLTDGAPEPETAYYHLYNIDRVEVLKGPIGFLYGGNSLSGSVNLIRKQPAFENLFEIGSSYGSFGSYNGTLDFNVANSDHDIAFRVNGLWQTSDFYRDDKSNKAAAINPAFTWQLDDNNRLDLNFEYVRNEYEPDSGVPIINRSIADVPRTRSYQSPFDVSDQDVYRFRVDYETKLNSVVTLRDKFYNTRLDWLTDGTLLSGTFPDGFGGFQVIRSLTSLDDHQNLVGNQAEAVVSFKTGTVAHQVLTGFEVSRLGDDFTFDVAFLPTIDLFNPVETATKPLFFIPGQSLAADSRSIVIAPYVADQIVFSDKFQLLAGGRFDSVDFENKLIALDKRNDKKFSPLFGVVYSPKEAMSFYFNAGTGFSPASSLVVGEREPEETRQFEVGARNQFIQGKIVTSFAVYTLDKQNIAIPDDNGITRQTGDLSSSGFEFELMAHPSREWSAFLNYAYNDSELTNFAELVFNGFGFIRVDRSGNTPAFAPKHILNIWATRAFKNGFGIGGGPRYVSDQFIAEDNVNRIDGYLTIDAVAFYDYGNFRFMMNFKNLTDKKYEIRGFGSNAVIPANPFAIYGGIEFRR